MNKVLIAIGVVLSAYLIYTSVSKDEEVNLEAVAKIETKTTPKNYSEEDELIDPEDNVEVLDGVYSLYYITEIAETNQEYTFSEDHTFELTRKIVVPANDKRAQIAKGTYEIVESNVVLKFEEGRNRKFFPENVITLKMLKDGNLKYDDLIVEKQYF